MSVFSSARTISLATLASRVLGLIRDMLSASILGRSAENSAFIFAFLVPNLFRHLFGEGALLNAFVPVYVEYLEKNRREDADALGAKVIAFVVLILSAVTAFVIGASMLLVFCFPLDEGWDLTLKLIAILISYVILICLVAVFQAILNSHKHFFTSAMASVVLNVFWIGGLLAGWFFMKDDKVSIVYMLAGVLLLAGVVEALMHIPALRHRKIPVKPDFKLTGEGIGKVRRNMLPMLLGISAVQLNMLMDQVIARAVITDQGAVATLYYANRMIQFPFAMIGLAIGTALLPTLAGDVAAGRKEELKKNLEEGITLASFLGIGALAGIMALSVPIIAAFFQRGEFTAYDTGRTAYTLVFYSLAILPYCIQVVLARVFYAFQDTRTPVKAAVAALFVNLTLNLTLVWFMEEGGIALATAISSMVNVIILLYMLKSKLDISVGRAIARSVIRGAVASAFMAAACIGLLYAIPGEPVSPRQSVRLAHLAIPLIAGFGVFLLVSAFIAKKELRLFISAIYQRRGKK
jgi:putative peptidoglycan lipid II flippase